MYEVYKLPSTRRTLISDLLFLTSVMEVSFRMKILLSVTLIFVALYFFAFAVNKSSYSERPVDFGEKMGNAGYQSERQFKNRRRYAQASSEHTPIHVHFSKERNNSFSKFEESRSNGETGLSSNFIRTAGDVNTHQSRGRYNFRDLHCISTIPEQLVGAVQDMPIFIPESLSFSPEVLACLYHRYVTTKQTGCIEPKLFGNANNKGGYICVDDGILNKNNCQVYIFSRAVDDRYKDQLKLQYGCTVNNVASANRNLFLETSSKSFLFETLRKWISFQTKTNNVIDLMVIELSTDENDIYIMNELLQATHLMSRIKQISLRINLQPATASSLDYKQRLLIFKELHKLNFRIFHFNLDWQCKPDNIQKSTFLSCYSVYMMRPSEKDPLILTLPSKESVRAMDEEERHTVFHRFVSSNQVLCRQNIRVGNVVSGGWNICYDPVYRPSYPCLVYSFGINDDWTFDEDMAETFGCEVHSFDPSIGRKSYSYSDKVHFHNIGIDGENRKNNQGWDLRTLKSIMSTLGHSDRRIDILKLDVEGSEWPALKHMFETGTINKIGQLNVEYHGRATLDMFLVAKKLHELNFRIHWSNMNLACSLSIDNGFSTECFEVYYISNHYTTIS